eukprot:9614175-Karenia_brevis.AAC.1
MMMMMMMMMIQIQVCGPRSGNGRFPLPRQPATGIGVHALNGSKPQAKLPYRRPGNGSFAFPPRLSEHETELSHRQKLA